MAGTIAGAGHGRADHELVAVMLARHADSLLATARRHSLCHDDASDAYQRALELFLRHAHRLDADRAHRWLHTVVKNEAITLRAERQRVVPRVEHDFDGEARHQTSPDDRVLERDDVDRMTEALGELKPAERQALALKADGLSYAEIAGRLGWTHTKVNRSLAEGRSRARARFALLESGRECDRWAPLLDRLQDGTAAAAELAGARRHLRICRSCRASVRALHTPSPPMVGVAPLGLAGLVAWWQERAVAVAVRGQVVAEALMSTKGMAVAASAAALTSGGVAAVDRALEPPSRSTAAQVHSRAAPSGGRGFRGGAAQRVAEHPHGGRGVVEAGPGRRQRARGPRPAPDRCGWRHPPSPRRPRRRRRARPAAPRPPRVARSTRPRTGRTPRPGSRRDACGVRPGSGRGGRDTGAPVVPVAVARSTGSANDPAQQELP